MSGTAENLLRWVRHLSHKTWSDGCLIADFIDAVSDHFKLEVSR